MATVTVDADIEMDDFSTSEIISELRYRVKRSRRQLTETEKSEIIVLCNHIQADYVYPIKTLEDKLKFELLNEAMKRFTISELETRLSK